jgi:uncharacterized protein (DUF58 family)
VSERPSKKDKSKKRGSSLLRRALTARGRSLEITRAGWLFIGLTLAVGFAAINSGSNLLHAIFGAQMALIIGSGMLSESAVRRASARRVVASTVHAGSPTPVAVELKNLGERAELLSVSVEDDDRNEDDSQCAPVFAVRVPPGGAMTLNTTVTMPQRGRHRLPHAVVATRFPFGLFVKRRDLPEPPEVLVYPKVHHVAPRVGESARAGQGEASGRVARFGEFLGLREYRDGDDPRRIYWPTYARLQRPVVREHEAQGDTEIVLDLPVGKTGNPAFETEVERVASLAVANLQIPGVAVGLKYGGVLAIEPASGSAQRRRLLEFLALVGEAA